MKTIKYINTFAISLPFAILLTYPIFKETVFFFSLYSTMLTGFLQVVLGLILLFSDTKNLHIRIYILVVILFFLLWYPNATLFDSNELTYFLFAIPPTLAIYLSVLIYKKDEL